MVFADIAIYVFYHITSRHLQNTLKTIISMFGTEFKII